MRYQAVPWIRYRAEKDIQQFLSEHGRLRVYEKGQCVMPAGEKYPYLSLIISGMLSKSFAVHNSSKDFAMSVLLPGTMVGDFHFMSKRVCNLQVIALRESSLIECPHDTVEKAMFADYSFYRKIMNQLMLDMESDSEGLATITARPADERLKILMKILLVRYNVVPDKDGWYKLPVYMTHNEMSRIIYSTPLTVNRLLLSFKEDGQYIRGKSGERLVNIRLFDGIYDWCPDDPLIKLTRSGEAF